MDGVLRGFFVVGVVLVVGYLLARFSVLGAHEKKVLSTVAFTVGLPSLMLSVLATRHIGDVFSPTALVSIISAVGVMALYTVAGAFRGWGIRRSTIGAMTAGIVNATILGIPLSVYILGSATYVTPIMLFQLGVLAPVALTLMDLTDPAAPKVSVWRILTAPLKNPVTIAAIVGITVSASGIQVPELLLDPVSLVAQMTVPLMLIIFGMSLHEFGTGNSSADRAPTALAIFLKSAAQPALAWALAAFIFHLDTFSTFVVIVCAILPTGQNVVLYAVRYGVAQTVAQSTALTTTVLAVPLLLGAALVFH